MFKTLMDTTTPLHRIAPLTVLSEPERLWVGRQTETGRVRQVVTTVLFWARKIGDFLCHPPIGLILLCTTALGG